MNKKLIRRQHVITFFGIFTIIGLAALAISQIRLAKTRKLEAETKANLFHLQGRLMAERMFSFGTTIDTESWPSGIYVWEIWNDNQKEACGKWVKE